MLQTSSQTGDLADIRLDPLVGRISESIYDGKTIVPLADVQHMTKDEHGGFLAAKDYERMESASP